MDENREQADAPDCQGCSEAEQSGTESLEAKFIDFIL